MLSITNYFLKVARRHPNIYSLLVKLYTYTFLKYRKDKRYFRKEFQRHLSELSDLVTYQGMTGGVLTQEGEFFLGQPDELFIYYNFRENEFLLGDGQSLDLLGPRGGEEAEKVLFSLLQDGMHYFDIGANNGYSYALKVARRYPSCKVFAFEPNPKILHHLHKNVVFNQLSNIQIIQEALREKVGLADLAFEFGASSFIPVKNTPEYNLVRVECNTLDNYVNTARISKVDFVKVDIEGGEFNFLRGAEETLDHFSPIMIIELKERLLARSLSSDKEVIALLESHGYLCYWISGSEDAVCIPSSQRKQIRLVEGVGLKRISLK